MNLRNICNKVSLSLIALTALVTALLYRWLPDQIPTHFDAHGVANGFMPRPIGAWFGVALSVGLYALLAHGGRFLPADWRTRVEKSPMAFVVLLTVGLMSMIQGVILYASLVAPPDVATLLALALGGFWVALGLVTPRVRRNPFVGIRTAWTLTSDENWARTHRLAGLLFVAAGLVAVLGGLVGSLTLGIAAIVTSALASVAYSFVLAKKLAR